MNLTQMEHAELFKFLNELAKKGMITSEQMIACILYGKEPKLKFEKETIEMELP